MLNKELLSSEYHQNLTHEKSTLVVWPYGVTRPQWVSSLMSTEIIDKTIKYKPKFKRFSIQGIRKKWQLHFLKSQGVILGAIDSTGPKFLPSWWQALSGAKCRRQTLPASTTRQHYTQPSVWHAIYVSQHELKVPPTDVGVQGKWYPESRL